MLLTEKESYRLEYTKRCLQTYQPGDKVKVGPAYQQGGSYRNDEHCGVWYVIRRLENTSDYFLSRDPDIAHGWDLICHASRLELVS